MSYKIYNDDCFNIFNKIEDKVNLVLVDLPYGQTACKWDIKIDLKKMWEELIKISICDTIYIFFTTTKYGVDLINSKPTYFRYDLVWEKTNSVGFLSSKKLPLRKHEMLYIFSRPTNIDLTLSFNKKNRERAKKIYDFFKEEKITQKQIFKIMGNQGLSHYVYSWNGKQFSIPTKKNYDKLVDFLKLKKYKDEIESFEVLIEGKEDLRKYKKSNTYNPQMTKGKPYERKGGDRKESIYGHKKNVKFKNEGTRYPTSIIKSKRDKEKLHPTQKPVELCEWLIKTYSNEGDIVLDFTMGSGSTGIACLNTGRHFIGIEMDKKIFNIAQERINNHLNTKEHHNQNNKDIQ